MERSQRQIVMPALAWVVAHVLLVVVLDLRLWTDLRPRNQLPVTLGFWMPLAMAVQTPFLLTRAGSWRGWPWWAVAWGGLTLASVVLVYPFSIGATYGFCRGGSLNSAPCSGAYLLASQLPVGLLVGTIQWALLRRSVRRAGWMPLAQLIGAIALAVTFTATRYDVRLLPLTVQMSALPYALAGGVYALVTLPALLYLGPRRGTVSASTPLELPDDDPHLENGSP